MAEEGKGNGGQFPSLLNSFCSYVELISTKGVERIADEENRITGEALASTAIHIAKTFANDAQKMYSRVESDIRTRLDDATHRTGGNVLIQKMFDAGNNRALRLSGFWEKAFDIIEAIKKIIKDIMNVSLFGVSLNDIIGVAVDIDEIFRVLDNILQTIGGMFGGSRLQQRMYDAEVRNIDMEMRLVRLKRLKWSVSRLE